MWYVEEKPQYIHGWFTHSLRSTGKGQYSFPALDSGKSIQSETLPVLAAHSWH